MGETTTTDDKPLSTTAEAMSKEFYALLDKYNCEVFVAFTVTSDDKVQWHVNFREKRKATN